MGRRRHRYFYPRGPKRDQLSISVREEKHADRLFDLAARQIARSVNAMDADDAEDHLYMFLMVFREYFRIVLEPPYTPPQVIWPHITIANFVPTECGNDWRFRERADIGRLYKVLKIPDICGPFDNGSKLPGEKLFLFTLRLVTSSQRFSDLMDHLGFGGVESTWSRGVRWLLDFIVKTHGHLLYTIKPQWAGHFPQFATAIRNEANRKSQAKWGHNVFTPGSCVAAFVDCNVTKSCMLNTGPAFYGKSDSADPERADPTGGDQESIYSGHKGVHGGKSQDVSFPNGMTGLLTRMFACRHNDNYLFTATFTNLAFAFVQLLLPVQHLMYGDSIYPYASHLRSRHTINPGDPHQTIKERQNLCMKAQRICIEWHFGIDDQLFVRTATKGRIKFGAHKTDKKCIENMYFFRVLLRNCYVCLYGSKTGKRPPDAD